MELLGTKRLNRRTHGFSLVELILILAVGSILAAIAVPPVQEMAGAYRLSSSAGTVTAELNAARMLAISRGAQYTITIEGNAIQVTDPGDPGNPLRARKLLDGGVTFSSLPANTITFFSRGHAQGGTIQLQNEHGEVVTIEVLASGQIQILDYGVEVQI